MNRSIFWRLVWKEYRLQRALWIAMVLLTSFLLWLMFELSSDPRTRTLALFRLAIAFPALYALGCGATLFAGEQEAETYEFQRSLPVSARRVFAAKIAIGIVGIVSLFGLMWLVAAFLNGWRLTPPDEPLVRVFGYRFTEPVMDWATFGFFGLETFLWATFFSLQLKRVLVAAILGVTAASIGAFIMAMSVTPQIYMETYVEALPRRAVLAAVVALADFWLAARWFRERRGWSARFAHATTAAAGPTRTIRLSDRFRAPMRTAILGRLVWQHWRQSFWLVATVFGVIIVPWILVGLSWLRTPGPASGPKHIDQSVLTPLASLLSLIGIPLIGLCAFHADQWRRSYRFLADRGVPPKYVWLSRQAIAFGAVFVVLIAVVLAAALIAAVLLPGLSISQWNKLAETFARNNISGYFILAVFGYVVLGITVGQFTSMFLRSGFLAGILSVLLAGLLVGWCTLMLLWRISWLWSVLPIPLVLLLATRLRTRDWLLERNTLRAWLPPAAVLVVPMAAILTAVPPYRIYSVPLVDPGFSLQEYNRLLTPEEDATLNLYRDAYRSMSRLRWKEKDSGPPTHADEVAWVNQSREAIALALKASQRDYSPLLGVRLLSYDAPRLADLLIQSAMQLEEGDQLDAAFERYLAALKIAVQLHARYPVEWSWDYDGLHRGDRIELEVYARLPLWAARPGQTPERLLAAASQLAKVSSIAATRDGIKAAYCSAQRFLMGNLDAVNRTNITNLPPVPPPTLLWMRLPWERARALRLLDQVTRRQLDLLTEAEDAAKRGEAIPQPPPGPRPYSNAWYREKLDVPYALQKFVYVPPLEYGRPGVAGELVRAYTAVETSRRATHTLLAIEAWRLQHGSLPKTLDELVGPCLDRLPIDPYAGQPFRYLGDGLAAPFSWSQPTVAGLLGEHIGLSFYPSFLVPTDQNIQLAGGHIDAHRPFLWSVGEKVFCKIPGVEDSPVKYGIFQEAGDYYYSSASRSRWANSMFDVWASGWPFPVPPPGTSAPDAEADKQGDEKPTSP